MIILEVPLKSELGVYLLQFSMGCGNLCQAESPWFGVLLLKTATPVFPLRTCLPVSSGRSTWCPLPQLRGMSLPSSSEVLKPLSCSHAHSELCGCCSIAQSCLTLCNTMDCSTPGLPLPHHLPEFTQVHADRIGDTVQPSHPLTLSSPVLNLAQHQGLFQWIVCLHQMTKILELRLLQMSLWIQATSAFSPSEILEVRKHTDTHIHARTQQAFFKSGVGWDGDGRKVISVPVLPLSLCWLCSGEVQQEALELHRLRCYHLDLATFSASYLHCTINLGKEE